MCVAFSGGALIVNSLAMRKARRCVEIKSSGVPRASRGSVLLRRARLDAITIHSQAHWSMSTQASPTLYIMPWP